MKKLKVSEFKNNPRKITDEELKELGDSLERYGDLSGNTYNRRSKSWVGGNQRGKILGENGKYEIEIVSRKRKPDEQGTIAVGYIIWEGKRYAYREVDWDEETERRANIVANKLGGSWDTEILREYWEEEELKDSGWKEEELKEIYVEEDKGKEVIGDIKFSVELGRTADFIVLKFDNKVDFLQAKTLLDLPSTYSKRQNGKPWNWESY